MAAALSEINQIPVKAQLSLITEPDDGLSSVQDIISHAAEKSLDLVDYELEDPALEQELVNVEKSGVKVRVILQNVSSFGNHRNQAAYDFLKNNNVPVEWAQSYFALTHQKTLIADGTLCLIMTFNLVPKYYKLSGILR